MDIIEQLALSILLFAVLATYLYFVYRIVSKHTDEECAHCPMRDLCFKGMMIGYSNLCDNMNILNKSQN